LHASRASGSQVFLLNSLSDRRSNDGASRRLDYLQRSAQKNPQLAGRQSVIGLALSPPENFTESNHSETTSCLANFLQNTRVAFELDVRVALQTHTLNGKPQRPTVTSEFELRFQMLRQTKPTAAVRLPGDRNYQWQKN
jgi:hypothetical protein